VCVEEIIKNDLCKCEMLNENKQTLKHHLIISWRSSFLSKLKVMNVLKFGKQKASPKALGAKAFFCYQRARKEKLAAVFPFFSTKIFCLSFTPTTNCCRCRRRRSHKKTLSWKTIKKGWCLSWQQQQQQQHSIQEAQRTGFYTSLQWKRIPFCFFHSFWVLLSLTATQPRLTNTRKANDRSSKQGKSKTNKPVRSFVRLSVVVVVAAAVAAAVACLFGETLI